MTGEEKDRELRTYLAADTHADNDWTEQGRRLASQRDNLIASGVDPSELQIPAGPPLHEPADRERVDLEPGDYWLTSLGDGRGRATVTADRRLLVEQFPDGDSPAEWSDLTDIYPCSSWRIEPRISEQADRDADNVPSDRELALRAEVGRWVGRADRRLAEAQKAEAEVARLRADLDAVEDEKTALYHDRQGVIREVERLRDGWRSVTSALGYGDGITEPQISFAEFIRECEQRFSEADEWRESQRWRDECMAAGHPDTEDCFEHDPTLRLESLADEWQNVADYNEDTHPREARAFRKAALELRAALRGPKPTEYI